VKRLRRTAPPAALAAALLALTACTHSDDDKHTASLTGQQAEALALARFTDYRAGRADITATVPLPGNRLLLTARLDWRAHTGYGLLHGTTPGTATPWQHLLRWNRTTVAAQFNWPGKAPATPPAHGWSTGRTLNPETSTVDTALALLLNLAADRPDNAQLLARSGAQKVGITTIDGQRVTEYTGPATHPATSSSPSPPATATSHTRYWIDSRNALLRFAALLPGSAEWMTVHITLLAATTAP